jgi:hypothetical protein
MGRLIFFYGLSFLSKKDDIGILSRYDGRLW